MLDTSLHRAHLTHPALLHAPHQMSAHPGRPPWSSLTRPMHASVRSRREREYAARKEAAAAAPAAAPAAAAAPGTEKVEPKPPTVWDELLADGPGAQAWPLAFDNMVEGSASGLSAAHTEIRNSHGDGREDSGTITPLSEASEELSHHTHDDSEPPTERLAAISPSLFRTIRSSPHADHERQFLRGAELEDSKDEEIIVLRNRIAHLEYRLSDTSVSRPEAASAPPPRHRPVASRPAARPPTAPPLGASRIAATARARALQRDGPSPGQLSRDSPKSAASDSVLVRPRQKPRPGRRRPSPAPSLTSPLSSASPSSRASSRGHAEALERSAAALRARSTRSSTPPRRRRSAAGSR